MPKCKRTKSIIPIADTGYINSYSNFNSQFRSITFYDVCNDCELITYIDDGMENIQAWEDILDCIDFRFSTNTIIMEGDFRWKLKRNKEGIPLLNADSILGLVGTTTVSYNQVAEMIRQRDILPFDYADYEYISVDITGGVRTTA